MVGAAGEMRGNSVNVHDMENTHKRGILHEKGALHEFFGLIM